MYPTLSSADLQNKTVLLRAGFDVPLDGDTVTDPSRVDAVLPTMKHILDAGAALIIMAHQGRPKGERVPEYSQKPLLPLLSERLGTEVQFAEFATGEATSALAAGLQPGQVLLLENLRYEAAEKSKDSTERDAFGKQLADLADVYVNDAFTNCHRDHASMTSVPKFLPSFMGLQLEKEVSNLSQVTHGPAGPVTLIVSGAKMETKVPVIDQFLNKGDDILLGGCIANTFIAASDLDVGASKFEQEQIATAESIILAGEAEEAATIHIPDDVVVATEFSSDAVAETVGTDDIASDQMILDVGQRTAEHYADVIKASQTIIWNGPLGVYEHEQFAGASKVVADALVAATAQGATTIVGGGDSVDFLVRYNYSADDVTFISTGGGAMLEFIADKPLPALEALLTA